MITYKVKVYRQTPGQVLDNSTYLWGGAGLTKAPLSTSLLQLTVELDEIGEVIQIGTLKPGTPAVKSAFGTLEPGQRITMDLANLIGVYADCNDNSLKTFVSCTLHQAL
jgi:hypothetical protein